MALVGHPSMDTASEAETSTLSGAIKPAWGGLLFLTSLSGARKPGEGTWMPAVEEWRRSSSFLGSHGPAHREV